MLSEADMRLESWVTQGYDELLTHSLPLIDVGT